MSTLEDIAAPSIFPLIVGALTLTAWDGFSYVDTAGRTYWSGALEPSAEDAADCLANPRTPPAPVPVEVSPWQIRRALNAAGLRATVEAAVAAADQDTRDGWEFATAIRRDNPLIAALAAHLGMTDAQVDQLFRDAASTTASTTASTP